MAGMWSVVSLGASRGRSISRTCSRREDRRAATDFKTGHSMRNSACLAVKTVLLVDDEDQVRVVTKMMLTNFGYVVDSVRNAEEALMIFDATIHDVVVVDNSTPGMTGAELAHVIKLRSPSTPVLMYSGAPPGDRSCLDTVLVKPAHVLELKAAVDRLVADRRPGGSG